MASEQKPDSAPAQTPGEPGEDGGQDAAHDDADRVVVDPAACTALSLRLAVEEAFNYAHSRREVCTIEHLLLTLLDERQVRRALDALDIDRAPMRREVVAFLNERADEHRQLASEGAHEVGVSDLLMRCWSHAISADDLPVHGVHMLVQLLRDEHRERRGAKILASRGITRLQLMRYVAHGVPRSARQSWFTRLIERLRPARRAPEARQPGGVHEHGPRSEIHAIPQDEVELVVHNDPYTTKEFVIQVLERNFGAPPGEAEDIMLEAHHTGAAMIGIFSRDVAEQKLADIHAQATERGYPLLVSTRAHRPPAPHWLSALMFRVGRWLR